MSVHTSQEQEGKAWKVRREIGRKLAKYRGAKIGQIEQFGPATINLDCGILLWHLHILD